MGSSSNFDEYDFLDLFYQEMLAVGHARNLVRLSVDAKMVEDIYENTTVSVTEEHLQKLADICLANSWLEHTVMGTKYGHLQLTTTGFGVVKSKRKQRELLDNRGFLKKTSDYIEDHKGLFVLMGLLIAIAGLLITYSMGNGNGQ